MTKCRFDEIGIINRGVNEELTNKVKKIKILLNNAKNAKKNIASGRIDRSEAINMFNDVIANEIETVKKAQTAKNTENKKTIV